MPALLTLSGVTGCGGDEGKPATSTAPPAQRVLIIGIDGASPRVVDAMMANGRLKNLRSIAERGTYGPFKSELSPLSPRVWTTIATGKVPEKHGIYGWVKTNAGADSTELFYSTDRTGLALWNILSDAGKSVAVVNWLITYPPEKINGTMISDHILARQMRGKEYLGEMFAKAQGQKLSDIKGSHNSASAVYPPEWEERAMAQKHAGAVLSDIVNPFLEASPDFGFGKRFKENMVEFWDVDQRLTSMTLEILDERMPDTAMVLLQGIDRVSHFLFGCLEFSFKYPASFDPTAEQRMNCQKALFDFYEFTDDLIGHILERYDDDDLVLVVSDHGFEPIFEEFRTGGHQSEDTAYGVLFARGPRIQKNGKVLGTNAPDLIATVLDWYGLPLAQDMDGKPALFLEPAATPAPAPVPTYDTKPVERLSEGASGGDSRVKEQLRSLGYLQ